MEIWILTKSVDYEDTEIIKVFEDLEEGRKIQKSIFDLEKKEHWNKEPDVQEWEGEDYYSMKIDDICFCLKKYDTKEEVKR